MANTNFSEEFNAGQMNEQVPVQETNTELPEGAVATAAVERQTYELMDGTQGSRAAFIREQFTELNKSRKAIAEEFGFDYRVVYSATVNMVNEAEPAGRGRQASNAVIKVNSENQLVEIKDVDGQQVTFVNGEAADVTYNDGELTDKNRNEWIKEQVDAGMSRGDVSKILGLSYGVVYGLTKDAENTRTTHMVTLEDGTEISRAEYIRRRIAEGASRSEVAKELDVPYSTVWQATKTERTDTDKFKAALETIESYLDQLDNKDEAEKAIAVLQASNILEKTEEPAEASSETATE